MKNFLKSLICAALILAMIPGCSSEEEVAETTAKVTTVATTDGTPDPEKERQEIKNTYKLSDDKLAQLASENTPSDIVYAGFDSRTFETPVISDSADLMTITPIYAHTGIEEYFTNYSDKFDLGEGEGSFKAAMEKFTEEFFNDKALLVVSFLDKDGGANYMIKGAWEELVVGDNFEMEKFVLAAKKADGSITAGHFIVEIDQKFLAIWDTFGVEFYK